MKHKESQYSTCKSRFMACWAGFFSCKSQPEELETIRLVHPKSTSKPPTLELQQVSESPLDNATMGETMWLNYVENHFDFENEAEFINFAKNPFLKTCYQFLQLAANEGCKTSMEYLGKIPGQLRLELDKQLKTETVNSPTI